MRRSAGPTARGVRRAARLLVLATVLAGLGLASGAPVGAAGVGVATRPAATTLRGDVAAVRFVDALHGWAVGAGGAVAATADAGSSWTRRQSHTTHGLWGVAFEGRSRGWVVGDAGAIVATTDGGIAWRTQVSGTNESLHAVAFTGPTDGWAVGDAGTIVATTDGGAAWLSQVSGTNESLHAVAFTGPTDGWAVGDAGTIVATTDGGVHWSAQGSGTTAALFGLHPTSANRAVAVGAAGTILATTDGGVSWRARRSGTTRSLVCVSFAGAGRGWAAGASATLLATTDGGLTWKVPPPKPAIVAQPITFGAKRRAETVAYNRRHYGQATWRLTPKVIVLHYTAGGTEAGTHATFNADKPDLGVLPGVVAHFVIAQDGRIYQQLPTTVRGRHTVGLNHVAIGIEFVQDAGSSPTWATTQIFRRKAQLAAGLRLVRYLAWRYHIKQADVIGHGMANGSPYFKDLLHWRNTHVDWLAPAVRRFRALLGG